MNGLRGTSADAGGGYDVVKSHAKPCTLSMHGFITEKAAFSGFLNNLRSG